MGVRTRSGDLVDVAAALLAADSRVDEALDVAVRAAVEVVGDCAAAWLPGSVEGAGERFAVHHRDPETDAEIAAALTTSADAVESPPVAGTRREPLVLTAPDRDELARFVPPRHRPLLDRLAIRAVLVCPFVAGDDVVGYLALARTAGEYTAADVDIAAEIAALAATALSTARETQRLRASEARYRRIVETTLDGVWQIDGEGLTTFVNERMAALLGVSREAMVGLSMRGFLDNEGQAELPRRLTERRQGLSEVYEARLIRADGSTLWVQMSASPVTVDGRPGGSVCMVTDITERVMARDMRRQLEQLRRADSLGQLAGGIAHDFNNLLTIIAGSAEVLAGEVAEDPDKHQLATQIVQAAARGAGLTHQLLAFGRRSPHAQVVSIPDLLDGARELLGRALGEHIRLDVHAEPGLWRVNADRGQLEQALANLAANARDAMGRGGVLTIEAANALIEPGQLGDESVAGRFVRIAVSDTGTGMDRPTQERAFEPFFTTRQSRGGAGLGLATVEGIVRQSGGQIRLYSEAGIGTTVKIFLPAVEGSDAAAAPVAAAVSGGPRRGRILVVEDQPELAQLTRYLLEPAGYTVTVATDAAAAMAHIHTGAHPDLLLTDVVMPGMTGPELARALRARRPGLRVLYMSGYTAGVLNPQGHLDADSALLQKPFNRETLLSAVARALSR
jgi:two-component system, cell cycle sensor histidine kinase and response regulator CckA